MHTGYLIKAIEGGSQLITAVGNTLGKLQCIMVNAVMVQMVQMSHLEEGIFYAPFRLTVNVSKSVCQSVGYSVREWVKDKQVHREALLAKHHPTLSLSVI